MCSRSSACDMLQGGNHRTSGPGVQTLRMQFTGVKRRQSGLAQYVHCFHTPSCATRCDNTFKQPCSRMRADRRNAQGGRGT
jgi:hypothetical protein